MRSQPRCAHGGHRRGALHDQCIGCGELLRALWLPGDGSISMTGALIPKLLSPDSVWETHPDLAVRIAALHQLQSAPNTHCLNRHDEAAGIVVHLGRHPYHSVSSCLTARFTVADLPDGI